VSFYDKDGNYIGSPKDTFFFDFLLSLGNNKEVWGLVQELAAKIDRSTEFSELEVPTLNGTIEEEKVFSAIAAAMIAEERKVFTKLGKRVKLLGIYQALILGFEPTVAANWSKGKRWREIDKECKRFGF
jgi:hypothetical protein